MIILNNTQIYLVLCNLDRKHFKEIYSQFQESSLTIRACAVQ